MNLTKYEKLALIFLSALLLAGSVVLYARHSKPLKNITIVEGSFNKELSLKEVNEKLEESLKVGINSSAKEELTNIPGVGEVLAERIVEYRDAHGNFYAIEDLLEVEGIGAKKLEKIKEYIDLE